MRVTSVLGSPRPKKGNTATVLGWVEDELRAQGHDVDRINIIDKKVNGCKECYTCQGNPDEPGCPQEDDAKEIFERLMASDAMLLASPLFCWGFSSQIKPLIDRHFCLVTDYGTPKWKSLLEGKRAGLLVTCAGPIEENADLVVQMFQRLMDYAKISTPESLVIPFTTTPDAMGAEIKELAVKFAGRLVGA
jgi:multimeric flavodoxin WrbA